MEYVLMIIGIILGYMIYAKGVKDGKAFAEHRKVEILPKPIESFKKAKQKKETTKEEQAMINSINNMLNYDGFNQKVGG